MLSFYPTSIGPSTYSVSQNTAATLVYASVGAGCGKAFHIISPIGGALFNTSAVIARYTWQELTQKNEMAPFFETIFKVVIPLLSALGICLACGFSISIAGAVELQLVSFLPLAYVGASTNLIPDARLKLNSD